MENERRFRFGAVFTNSYEAVQWADTARRLEDVGFDTLLVADHYDNPMACGPLIMAAACATTTLRVGSYVYNNDFRHPALLANEAATIDVLSGGRLELGVGAGYHKAEYDQIGLSFDPPGVRAGRFEEAIEVMTRLFAGGQVIYKGKYYSFSELELMLAPLQQPIPLLIGGGGPRMTRIAVQRADIIALVPQSLPGGGLDVAQFAPEAMDRKIALLDAASAKAGRMDGGPEKNILITDMYNSLSEIVETTWVPTELVESSPWALVGETDVMVEALHERRERWGISYYVCFDRDLDRFIPVVRALAGVVTR
jgi:probable F420-dependent oxidoreductase